MSPRAPLVLLAAWGAVACGGDHAGRDASTAADASARLDASSGDDGGDGDDAGTPSGWTVAFEEDFEGSAPAFVPWRVDEVPDDGPYADGGAFFRARGVTPPGAFRATAPFGRDGWLTAELYSRSSDTAFADLVRVVDDPDGSANHVLRLATPAHTDGAVVRPTNALPERYRVSLRAGWADYGDGAPGSDNGYDAGTERAGPWVDADATEENGFYWLTILDAPPRPHNNVWIHHHRKVVIDSDNHDPPWMQIWDGNAFVDSGAHPVMMFAIDGTGPDDDWTGKPFVSWSADAWQPVGAIRAADAYRSERWYRVTIERFDDRFTLTIEGDFEHGGTRTYQATIDAAARCVWHFNQTPADGAPCVAADWPADGAWPDWFMFGDPHVNYYEGSVHYDDVRLEVWRD